MATPAPHAADTLPPQAQNAQEGPADSEPALRNAQVVGTGMPLLEERAPTDAASEILARMRRVRDADIAFALQLRQQLGLSGNDLAAVTLIQHCEAKGTNAHAKDIAHQLGVTSAAATIIVDRLVALGHVARAADPADGRQRILSLTPSTCALLERATQEADRALAELAATLSTRERTRLTTLLDAVAEILDAGPAAS
ncbi:winged helix DNA-binding protein [Frigoribacterium sp. CFBP 8766]|jgi:DNA-binding MarR family transcriptional regulator|uniref:MarR family winged helix-turn-helix transcriptional regulator n=1 Tax=Frigoribacterium sp. CFBP 8766 TaxID=2775273 RepID=UPI001785A055|nr:MarR family transcriptional regulator [Frigoribacterium sp. CFBP 8766]MBD8583791.1 winged helix DNA-binding protein [Frigoribacterium sp. CFBP 8766]